MYLVCCLFALYVLVGQCTATHYCPFFKNRAPSPQPNLENCTWFRENSCCLNHELNAIFSSISTPLMAASEACRRHMNYLMCYVCAPNQETFYEAERLTVCEEFCDRWYMACGEAFWKGSLINDLYSNGTEFCRARKFLVAPEEDYSSGCYTFAPTKNRGNLVSTGVKMSWITFALWTLFNIYTIHGIN